MSEPWHADCSFSLVMEGERGRVLVVDDDTDVVEYLADALGAGGYAVSTASDGAQALDILENVGPRPDIVVLDLAMPRVDGFGLLAAIRSNPETKDLPALVLTGFRREDFAAVCLDRGAADFIPKPVVPRELLARVSSHLRRSRELEAWRARSWTDPLTGLPNRAALVPRLTIEIQRARNACRCVAVAFLDVDRFKDINDTFGHSFGDLVLQRVAEGLSASLRTEDVAARWGGDELVVLLPDSDHRAAAEALERACAGIREHVRTWLGVEVGLSVGIAALGEPSGARPETEARELLDRADRAMYRVKRRRLRLADGTDAFAHVPEL